MHFPRPPAEGPAAGWASRIIAALMPAAGHRGGEGRGGEAGRREGRGVSGCRRLSSAPRFRRHTPPELGRVPVLPPRSSPLPRSPETAGAGCSLCRSRSATGFKVGATVPPLPRPQPAVQLPPACAWCPPLATCAHPADHGVSHAREAGAGPGARGPVRPRLPGPSLCLFQEGKRSACSKPGRKGGWRRSTG